MKRFALIAALIMALAAGFGCAKKTTDDAVAPDTSAMSPEMQAAIQQITDERVYFAFDKYALADEYKASLKNKAELMKRFSTIRVRIEGNCDARGTQEYNLALGEKRARVVYEYLVQLGVNPSQLEMISYGKENPAVEGTGEAVWSKNRRDDFRVTAY
ncbi:MAG: peptidoglycan-associated lipoprotein Pal [Desulfovibrionaceae bacterium]|nr:peptidoglycan-associated lipoprotein Pal [Desulfovibrionaceae bacterium]